MNKKVFVSLLVVPFVFCSAFTNQTEKVFVVAENYTDPFYKPTPKPIYIKPTIKPIYVPKPKTNQTSPIYDDPFNTNKPNGNSINDDPFNKPDNNDSNSSPIHDDPFNNKPSNDLDSGAYIEIEKLYNLSSYQAEPILSKIAMRKNLSSREQNMVIDFTERLYLEGKVNVLRSLLTNKYLTDSARVNLLALVKKDTSFYSNYKKNLLSLFAYQHNLTTSTKKRFIDTVFSSLDNQGDQELVLSTFVGNKNNKSGSNSYLIEQVGSRFSFEDKKVTVLNALVSNQKLSSQDQKTFIDIIINNINSNYNKQFLLDALFDNQNMGSQMKNYSYQNLSTLKYKK